MDFLLFSTIPDFFHHFPVFSDFQFSGGPSNIHVYTIQSIEKGHFSERLLSFELKITGTCHVIKDIRGQSPLIHGPTLFMLD